MKKEKNKLESLNSHNQNLWARDKKVIEIVNDIN